jgi:two-component system, OmpR family, alkaline phosphatase synthesis response regulator PhoP
LNRRILIADNDEQVRIALQPLLSNAGYTALFAVDGISLIERARKHQPHLIMLDFCLPAGNATALIKTLRMFPEFTRTPIFITAGREFRTSAGQIFDSGADAFLPKPFNRQVLFSLIARFLPTETNVESLIPAHNLDSGTRQQTNSSRVFYD